MSLSFATCGTRETKNISISKKKKKKRRRNLSDHFSKRTSENSMGFEKRMRPRADSSACRLFWSITCSFFAVLACSC
jgi:hypothetical protein